MDALNIAIFSPDMRMKMSWEQRGTNPSAGKYFVVNRTTVDFARSALARRIKYSQESK